MRNDTLVVPYTPLLEIRRERPMRKFRLCSAQGKKPYILLKSLTNHIYRVYNIHTKRQDLKRLCQRIVFIENNASFDRGRYFFMDITNSKRIIINVIMYSFSIAITSF